MIAFEKPTLLHVLGYAARGGCERCSEVFIRHCPEFKHHVVVLGGSGSMSDVWTELGATVEHLDILGLNWAAFHSRLRAAVRQSHFSRVILWAGIRVPLVLAALAPLRLPVVLHAGNPFTAPSRVRWWLRAGRMLPRPRDLTVIGCSRYVAHTYREAPYFRGLAVQSCLNPVETPPENPHRARTLFPDEPVRLGMVARLDPIKDHALLLRGFARLHALWPQAELHLAGDGPLRSELERLAVTEGIAEHVRFHGSVSSIPDFLRRLDLFVYCTTPHEGMGIALAEALAQGLPTVVNDLAVMREVGGDGDAAAVRFVPGRAAGLAEGIDALLRDESARSQLSDRAWRRATETFSPRRVIERYLSALAVPS